MSGKRQVRKQKTQKQITKLAVARERKILEEEEEIMLAKYDYLKVKITGYPAFVMYFILLVALAFTERSLLAIFLASAGFLIFGFLLKVHHENRIRKDEKPDAEDYFFAKRIMNYAFGFGTCYLGIAFFSILYFHNYR